MASGKGSNYEREMCRELSLWWSGGERDDLFWRSAGSGAMAKTRSKKGKPTFGQYGDIQATDPEGQALLDVFTIELKRGYNKDNFANMMDKPTKAAKQMWEHFLDQVREDAANAKSLSWMLIWRRDRRQALIYVPILIILQLKKVGVNLKSIPHMRGKIQLKDTSKIGVYLCALDDFLDIITPRHIRKVLKNGRRNASSKRKRT